MSPKAQKIAYYVSTSLLTALMLFSAGMYFTKTEMVKGFFTALSFPTWLVIPLAIAKLLGLVAIWSKASNWLKEWAYAGFFFDVVLAATAHTMIGDGGAGMAFAGILFVAASYYFDSKVFGNAAS